MSRDSKEKNKNSEKVRIGKSKVKKEETIRNFRWLGKNNFVCANLVWWGVRFAIVIVFVISRNTMNYHNFETHKCSIKISKRRTHLSQIKWAYDGIKLSYFSLPQKTLTNLPLLKSTPQISAFQKSCFKKHWL